MRALNRGEYSRILTIDSLERLRNSTSGNPRYRITFTDGTIADLQSDSSYGYEISNPGHGAGARSDGSSPNRPLVVTFTRKGQVSYARFAEPIDYIGAPEESPELHS